MTKPPLHRRLAVLLVAPGYVSEGEEFWFLEGWGAICLLPTAGMGYKNQANVCFVCGRNVSATDGMFLLGSQTIVCGNRG